MNPFVFKGSDSARDFIGRVTKALFGLVTNEVVRAISLYAGQISLYAGQISFNAGTHSHTHCGFRHKVKLGDHWNQ